MSTYVLAAYLILVGVIGLFKVDIPIWVAALLALIAGILLLVGDRITFPNR